MIMHDFQLVNLDTDSVSFCKPDGAEFSKEEMETLISEINNILPEMIEFEDDGYFEKVLIVKAKNYCLLKKGDTKLKIKGGSFKDSKKEPALAEMLISLANALVYDRDVVELYEKYISEALNITDIKRWCTKKNITKAVLTGTRTNETKVYDAVKHLNPREGDKFFLFSCSEISQKVNPDGSLVFLKNGNPKMVEITSLKNIDEFDGTYDMWHYVDRVYDTISILSSVINMENIKDYGLVKNRQEALSKFKFKDKPCQL